MRTVDKFLRESYTWHFTVANYEDTPFYHTHHKWLTEALLSFASEIREEAAKVAEKYVMKYNGLQIASAIRSMEIK